MANNIIQELKDLLIEKYPEYTNLFKKKRYFPNEGIAENIYIQTQNGLLEPVDSEEIKSKLFECLYELGIDEVNRQERIIKSFLQTIVPKINHKDAVFDLDGEQLFVSGNKIIDLSKIEGKAYSNISDMYEMKENWLCSTISKKENLFTRYSKIELPEIIDNDEYNQAIEKIYSILLRCMGGQKESVECFLDCIAAALYGKRPADYFIVLQGVGGTGKSLIIDLLQNVFGNYFDDVNTEAFLNNKPSVLQELFYKKEARIISICEPDNEKKKVSLLKKVSGRSTISVNGQKFAMNSLFIIDSNFSVEPDKTDSGFDRRNYIFPCGPKISEEEQNRKYKEEIQTLSSYFLLELVRRFSTLDLYTIKAPSIAKEVKYWNKVEREGLFIQVFMNICCTADVETGRNMTLKEIRDYYLTEFPDIYAQYRKKHLFWFDPDDTSYEDKISKTTAQEFNVIFSRRYKNQGIINGYQTVRHLVIGNPGEYETMEKYVIDVMKKRYNIDEDGAKEKIEAARQKSIVDYKENPFENDYRDLLAYQGLWGFFTLGIPDCNPKKWKNAVIRCLITSDMNGQKILNIQGLSSFQNNFVRNVMSLQEAERLCNNLSDRIRNLLLFSDECLSDPDIIDILDTIFDAFAKWFRNDLRTRNMVSISDPRLTLSQMNAGIPNQMLQPLSGNMLTSPKSDKSSDEKPKIPIYMNGKKINQ